MSYHTHNGLQAIGYASFSTCIADFATETARFQPRKNKKVKQPQLNRETHRLIDLNLLSESARKWVGAL